MTLPADILATTLKLRDELAAEVAELERKKRALRSFDEALAILGHQVGDDPHPTPARKVRDIPPPARPSRKSRPRYPAELKQAVADAARATSITRAAQEAGVSWGTVQSWVAQFPPIESAVPETQPDTVEAPSQLPFECSCKAQFATSKDWSQHLRKQPTGARSKHRIVRQPKASLVPSGLPTPPRPIIGDPPIVIEHHHQAVGA